MKELAKLFIQGTVGAVAFFGGMWFLYIMFSVISQSAPIA